jgi:hypothetical protein
MQPTHTITVKWNGADGGGCENIHIVCENHHHATTVAAKVAEIQDKAEDALVEFGPYVPPTPFDSIHLALAHAAVLAGVER